MWATYTLGEVHFQTNNTDMFRTRQSFHAVLNMGVGVVEEDGIVIDSEIRRGNVLDIEHLLAENTLLCVVHDFILRGRFRFIAEGGEFDAIDNTDVISATLSIFYE